MFTTEDMQILSKLSF